MDAVYKIGVKGKWERTTGNLGLCQEAVSLGDGGSWEERFLGTGCRTERKCEGARMEDTKEGKDIYLITFF